MDPRRGGPRDVRHGFRQRIRRADQELDDLGRGAVLVRRDVLAVIVVVPQLVQAVLLAEGKELDPPVGAPGRPAADKDRRPQPDGELAPGVVVGVGGRGELLKVVAAAVPRGGGRGLLTAGRSRPISTATMAITTS